jgi:hypothetical protein
VALIFERPVTRRTLGTFRTKVITKGVDPQLWSCYNSSRMNQYFKQHRALRTETVSSRRLHSLDRRIREPTADPLVGILLDQPYTSRQPTYDLRRLRRKQIAYRISGSRRYQLTPLGGRVASSSNCRSSSAER